MSFLNKTKHSLANALRSDEASWETREAFYALATGSHTSGQRRAAGWPERVCTSWSGGKTGNERAGASIT
ncbi:MAG TPA: hypothetical protein VFI31_15350 [Pirellulales bacterium]|nr:hypothetical protein [Pirellulales bacterium]